MSGKSKTLLGLAVAVIVVLFIVVIATVSVNDGQNWVYLQYPNGSVRIIDEPGCYLKLFGKNWVYPRYMEFRYNDDVDDGDKAKESTGVTYNDGGEADVDTFVRLRTPILKEDRISFHQQFGGRMDNIKASVKSYQSDCLKSTAPLMSSSENQSARKAEFRQIVASQLAKGTYKMSKEKQVVRDTTDLTGKEITIFKTEIIRDKDGNPIIEELSPIVSKYKMSVEQFSVTRTEYDKETREQFATKKRVFLEIEQAKADRQKEVQERLMIIEKGLKDKAEATAMANVVKEKAVIEAAQKAEVALQTKIEAETKAAQLLSVAEITKSEKLMIASMKLEVADIMVKEAEAKKKAQILAAEGMKQAIELSGAITEIEAAMIDAGVRKVEVAAKALSQIEVPNVMFINSGANGTNGENGAETDIMTNLINYRLLEMSGLISKANVNTEDVAKRVTR
ncbi:hypothetical protein HQ584_07195 [Patescibacteria group bacterium]|nr:hypothetical protein [Patescibacteria group bacterium]